MNRSVSRARTVARYRAVQARFKILYDQKRLRYDDCVKKLAAEFFLSETYVMRILAMELEKCVG